MYCLQLNLYLSIRLFYTRDIVYLRIWSDYCATWRVTSPCITAIHSGSYLRHPLFFRISCVSRGSWTEWNLGATDAVDMPWLCMTPVDLQNDKRKGRPASMTTSRDNTWMNVYTCASRIHQYTYLYICNILYFYIHVQAHACRGILNIRWPLRNPWTFCNLEQYVLIVVTTRFSCTVNVTKGHVCNDQSLFSSPHGLITAGYWWACATCRCKVTSRSHTSRFDTFDSQRLRGQWHRNSSKRCCATRSCHYRLQHRVPHNQRRLDCLSWPEHCHPNAEEKTVAKKLLRGRRQILQIFFW